MHRTIAAVCLEVCVRRDLPHQTVELDRRAFKPLRVAFESCQCEQFIDKLAETFGFSARAVQRDSPLSSGISPSYLQRDCLASEWRLQLVGYVPQKSTLRCQHSCEPFGHLVEVVPQLAQLIPPRAEGRSDSVLQIAFRKASNSPA
jgi:hypothetical protein